MNRTVKNKIVKQNKIVKFQINVFKNYENVSGLLRPISFSYGLKMIIFNF